MDYLNYLFSNNAFVVGGSMNPELSNLEILIPQITLKLKLKSGMSEEAVLKEVLPLLPSQPLEVKELSKEAKKVGSDMFIFLALENMRIYLIGGLLLAVIAILATALVNYLEDRRTLALLRVRGAAPEHIFKLLCSTLLPPTITGVLLGVFVALIGGYGMTNLIWSLRRLLTLIIFLPTHLVITTHTVLVGLLLLGLLSGVVIVFSLWAFRRTARESLKED
jgi:ABC-type lipoprotein release transport system permease subunit